MKDKQKVLEFIELLENEAMLYREQLGSITIEECLGYTNGVIRDFEEDNNL